MADFSSCYFCGAALDAPLEEYPVVPAELHPSPDQQGTVVLCPTCREKLGAIVGEVIDAVETDASLEGGRTTDATLQAATPDQGATTSPDAGSNAPDDSGASTGVDADLDADADTDTDTGTQTDTEADQSPIFDDADDEPEETDPYGPVFGDGDDEQETTDAADDEGDHEGHPPDAATDEQESSPATGDRTGRSADSIPDARTYNRVVRLLQNREFPVDRDEIEAVATNAYELSHEEFDGVIRVAMDRGILEEEGGQLVLPGDD